MKIHANVTASAIVEAIQKSENTLSNPGFCLSCGAYVDGVEPDACYYQCEECEANTVFGAEEILLAGYYHKD